MTKISCIVPVYKVEKYLRRCIDSILAQTFQDFDIILVDDESPDNCGAICDEYASDRDNIFVIHQKHGGLSKARNTGIDAANGEFITFVDSDDYIAENMFELLINQQMMTKADLAVVTGLENRYKEPYGPVIYSRDEVLSKFHERYSDELWCNVMGKLYHKRVFAHLRFKEGIIYEDTQIFPYILNECSSVSIEVVKDCLYFYETGNESIMRSAFGPKNFSSLTVWWDYVTFFTQCFPNDDQRDFYAVRYCFDYIRMANIVVGGGET